VITQSLPWIAPLEAASLLGTPEQCWVLLYSGQQLAHTGRYSYLALYPQETISGNTFALLAPKLGYEMLHDTESLNHRSGSHTFPDLWFTRFGLILVFDHNTQTITCHRESHIALPQLPVANIQPQITPPTVKSLTSALSRDAYLQVVAQTKAAITKGVLYQANITRKFTGQFTATPDSFALFCRLCEASPAAYSAFIRMQNSAIISSSPERFLTVSAEGTIESRPIKGTTPRFADKTQDEAARRQLENSEKDRAENLMIVDLMRNDLARSCKPGSVEVQKLFEVSSYATLHHMASTISGQKRSDIPTLDAVKYCFPPGSMTGAPKYRAMQWCLEHEPVPRGIYSGALGWFGGDGSCDLSVVIRTLVIEGKKFEFQVGGGIVADSDPEKEWQETITKARGIMKALGIEAKTLEDI
jgi:anthranilate/para-aminobenzoate synthase component I